jgi:hypothetical protein
MNFIYAQRGFSLQVIPKSTSTKLLEGTAPAGFKHQRFNPALSIAGYYYLHVNSEFKVFFGGIYNINTYTRRMKVDYNVDSIDFAMSSSSTTISYFQPVVGFVYSQSKWQKKISVNIGLNYKYTNSIGLIQKAKLGYYDIFTKEDSFFYKTRITEPTVSNKRIGFQVGLDYKLLKYKSLIMEIGLLYFWSEPSTKVTEIIEMKDKIYKHSYLLKNSFLGLNLQLRYEKEKKDKSKQVK